MTAILPVLFSFIFALAIGIYIGKLIFSAKMQAEKISLEEKVLASQAQIQNLKEMEANKALSCIKNCLGMKGLNWVVNKQQLNYEIPILSGIIFLSDKSLEYNLYLRKCLSNAMQIYLTW